MEKLMAAFNNAYQRLPSIGEVKTFQERPFRESLIQKVCGQKPLVGHDADHGRFVAIPREGLIVVIFNEHNVNNLQVASMKCNPEVACWDEVSVMSFAGEGVQQYWAETLDGLQSN